MFKKEGFTLIEIIVVLIIIALLVAFAIPNYLTSMQQGAAKAAQNNLVTIYNAEKSNYFSNNTYCLNTSPSPCDTLADINTSLNLNITDSNFTYACVTDTSGFSCTATNISNTNFTLTVTNNPLILPGATPPYNPSCTDAANPNYCPS